jgi:uncharacterized membrane protein YfcA
MLETEWILLFLLLGCAVGFMAGLLGIGGGGIMVPVLTSLFLLQGVPVDNVVHLALGTSMASIIATSIASLRAHHLKGGVIWHVVSRVTPGIVVGTFLATLFVSHIDSIYLALFFSMFMAYIAIQMFINKTPTPDKKRANNTELLIAGSSIGAISAIVSIGGGSLTVPYLISHNVDIKKAIGTSAAIGLPISIAGTLGYVIHGWQSYSIGSYTLGYVYFPAVLLISAASVVMAPYGAKLAHKLNVATLKKVFAILLIILSIKMLISVV